MEIKKGLVSIIIPIYNVEKYLNGCIESVVKQTYTNLEIILIDDGSPDNCPQICDEWAKKDQRIKVIHKENGGQGIARNTGIENATGEFVCFLDSDDYLDLTTIEKAYALAKKECAEIVVYGLKSVNQNGELIKSFTPCPEKTVFKDEEVLNEFFPEYLAPNPKGDGKLRYYTSSCLLFYSSEYINKIGWRYKSEREILSEDIYSQIELFQKVKKIAIIKEALYNYRENNNSFSRIYKQDKYRQVKHFYLESLKLCEKLGYSEEIKHRVSKHYIAFTITTLKQEYKSPRAKQEKKEEIKNIINDGVLQEVLRKSKKDKENLARKILFFAIRRKMYALCILLIKLKG